MAPGEFQQALAALPHPPTRTQLREAAEAFVREARTVEDDEALAHYASVALTRQFDAWLDWVPEEGHRAYLRRVFMEELYEARTMRTSEYAIFRADSRRPKERPSRLVTAAIGTVILFGVVPLAAYC